MKGKKISIVGSLARVWDTYKIVHGTNQVGDPNKNLSRRKYRCKIVVLDKKYYFIN